MGIPWHFIQVADRYSRDCVGLARWSYRRRQFPLLTAVSLKPRQRHRGGFSARQRGSASYLKFDQSLRLIAVTQAGRQQSRVNCRTPTTYANDAYDQNPNCDNPKEDRWTNQTISSSFLHIVSLRSLRESQ